jgi:replication fork protection complex subunit Csm3/Swi3
MPSKTAATKGPEAEAFVEDYLAGWDDEEDPFASPEPPSKTNDANTKKRRGTDALGIDEEIDLKKKPRVPRVKLDEGRLLSEKGIPKLRKMAPKLKLKGKGHEVRCARRQGITHVLTMDAVLRCITSTLLLPRMARRPVPES